MTPNAETAPPRRGAARSGGFCLKYALVRQVSTHPADLLRLQLQPGATLLLRRSAYLGRKERHVVKGWLIPTPRPFGLDHVTAERRVTTVQNHDTPAGGPQGGRPATNHPTSQLLDIKYRLEDWLFRCSEAIQDHAPDESAESIRAEIEQWLNRQGGINAELIREGWRVAMEEETK